MPRSTALAVGATRRLAAIMFTDMVGFTQGTQADERTSLQRLAEQERLVRPVIAGHEGHIVKSTGDGLLVEFPSALKATECAVSIQTTLRERNAAAGGPPIELRIGVHLGDVEQRGDDILGDAVNIAARVQPAAEAGGVAVSQQVFDQVVNKLGLPLEPLPPRPLKGVQLPVTIFRVRLPWQGGSTGSLADGSAAGRLAVLPFANISPDPHDAYFSDGLTEEVIAVLSELRALRVIARTSVDAYRSAPKPASQVGLELGVQWLLEGSVRKDGSRLRFTVKLIDVRSQEQLWTGRYDRELVDIFALQSELAHEIADALQIRLQSGESDRLGRRRAPKPDSYLEYLRGRAALRDPSQSSLEEARARFEAAIRLDPENASAYAGLAEAIGYHAALYRGMPRADARRESRRLARRALDLDPDLAEAHTMIASDLSDDYRYPAAEAELRAAISLNPSFPGAHLYYGTLLADTRRPDAALEELALAEQLDPLSALILGEEVSTLTYLGEFDRARSKLARLGEVEHEGILYHDRKGLLALATDDFEQYRREVEWFEGNFAGRQAVRVARAMLSAVTGDPTGARTLLATVESLPEDERPTGGIAPVRAELGDLDGCFEWIGRAIDEARFAPRRWLYDRRYEAVRRDPRFATVLRRAGVTA